MEGKGRERLKGIREGNIKGEGQDSESQGEGRKEWEGGDDKWGGGERSGKGVGGAETNVKWGRRER